MDIAGIGKRVRIYVGEADHWQGRPLYLAIIETLRAEGCAGATAFRGIAGFGAHSRIHAATIEVISANLPIVVEWIDAPERVDRVLPKLKPMVAPGMITIEDVDIAYYQHRKPADISRAARVADVMTPNPVRVRPELPLRDAVELLVGRDYRALPVVDPADHLLGIVTNTDLVERGGLRARVDLLGAVTTEQLAAELAALEVGKTVGHVMTRSVVTVGPQTSLADAAHLMVTRRLKRLPVVDQDGRLLGMVSRSDLLRTRAEAYPVPWTEMTPPRGQTIGHVMRTDVPVVARNAPLPEVLDAVVSTRLNRAIVVDEERRVVGLVSDAELLRRLSPDDHPSVVRILMSRLPFVHLSPTERENLAHLLGTTAEELMDRSVSTVPPNLAIGEAIALMLRERRKLLPVVDADGRLLGAADRADLLRALIALEDELHRG